MPQDGSNNYQYPPGTPGVPDQTIESEAYNTFLDDLVINDLNIPRPIHRGGTGANTSDTALTNLSGEKATQVVMAYLSHLWMPGSFRSAAGATDEPVAGHSFAGICYINEPLASPPTNQNVIVEARDQNDTVIPGRVYVRQKKAGVWDAAWVEQVGGSVDLIAIADARYVNLTGDTMTGLLTLSGDPDAALKAATKQYVDNRVTDALAYSGMQVNGAMEVSQELGDIPQTDLNGGICDGYRVYGSGTFTFQVGRSTTVPLALGIPGVLYLVVGTPQPSLGATHALTIDHAIEGHRTARLAWGTAAARPITIAFWSQHTRTGIHTVSVYNGDYNRSYCTSYTQVASDVAQYNVITVPGDTFGSWLTNSLPGVGVAFTVASGTTGTAPSANTWHPTGYNAVPGQVNGVATAGHAFRITGLTVLPGIYAPTAAQSPNIMRPYDQELMTCKRYWQSTYSTGVLPGTLTLNGARSCIFVGGGGFAGHVFEVEMRAAPTVTLYSPTAGYPGHIDGVGGPFQANVFYTNEIGFPWISPVTASTSSEGQQLTFHWTLDVRM